MFGQLVSNESKEGDLIIVNRKLNKVQVAISVGFGGRVELFNHDEYMEFGADMEDISHADVLAKDREFVVHFMDA